MKNTRQNIFILMLTVFMIGLSACSSGTFNSNGWQILVNKKNNTLTIKQNDLGVVVQDAKLAVRDEAGSFTCLTEWTLQKQPGKMTIQTGQPKQISWSFIADSGKLGIQCTEVNGVLTGVAPASESRIPARVKSQDNGVMYNALGFVSAGNIYSLFDRETDILIRFPEGSELTRNEENARMMDVKLPTRAGAGITLIKEYYNEEVGLAKYQKTKFTPVYKPIPKRFDRAPTGWSSWYCYYMTANEADMVKETDALARTLKPYGLEYVQLDACYTRGEEANYLDWNKEAFPRGGKWLFKYILDKGLKPGLWLNAYGANYKKPAMADKYPENFFLRNKNGNLSGACCTADKTVVRLDYTNPDVMKKHLMPMFDTLVNSWGLKYLKAGGWGTWMDYYEKNKSQAYDSTRDSRTVYRDVLMVIREMMGDDNYLLGCAMHEVGCGFGLFDGSRTGGDDLAQWYPSKESGMSMLTFFKSLFGANYLNGICWWSDPDDVQLRPPLTMEEAKTIATTISLSGQAYVISDFIADPPPKDRFQSPIHKKIVTKLPPERLKLYKATMPTRPIHTIDLYPYRCEAVVRPQPASFPRILDLKVNAAAGMYDVAALYNWSDEPAKKSLSLTQDLGLDPDMKYLTFDYWNGSFLGVYEDTLSLDVPVHGVRALVIHPLQNKPVVLATSRHLTGTVSLQEVTWDETLSVLSGKSVVVEGDPYSLYLFAPTNLKVDNVNASMKGKTEVGIKAQPGAQGSFIRIQFSGEGNELVWKVKFKKQS
ncbi:MAG: alpha-galactosidase [Bacteroidales bacterium]|nr:alpha-galactosidase [Bacteroidales bacterium]